MKTAPHRPGSPPGSPGRRAGLLRRAVPPRQLPR